MTANDWDPTRIQVARPTISSNLKENMNAETYSVMREFEFSDPVLKEENGGNQSWQLRDEEVLHLRPLLKLAHELELEVVENACLVCLATQLHIGCTE